MADIDARIPMAYRPAESGIESPFESMAKVTKLKTAQLEQQGMQLEQMQKVKNYRDQQQLQSIFAEHVASGGDPNDMKAVLPKIYAVNPMLGMSLQKQMAADAQKAALGQYETQKAKHDAQKAAQEQADYAVQRMGGILQAPEQEQARLYQQNRQDWINRGLISPEHMPEQYDPTWLKSVVAGLQHGTKNGYQWHETVNAQGQPVGQFLPIEPGQQYPIAPKAANAEAAAMAIQAKKNQGIPTTPEEDAQLKAFSDIKHPEKPVDQPKLEKEYRQSLLLPLRSRSGQLGVQDGKVNQAIDLEKIFDQSWNPKTKTYDIPESQYEELALGLAKLVAPTGTVGVEMLARMTQPTAYGKLQGLLSFVTGTPQTGNTQAVMKQLKEQIDRQGQTAEQLRETYLDAIKAQAPTDLEERRKEQLEKSLNLNSFMEHYNAHRARVLGESTPKEKATGGGGGARVHMMTPDGKRDLWVPPEEVEDAKAKGAVFK